MKVRPLRPKHHPALLAWLRLARFNGVVMRGADKRLRQNWEITGTEFDILAQIGATPGMTQQALSEQLLVTEGNITYQIAKLEKRGLLKRKVEGRCKHLYLSEAGQTLAEEALPEQEDWHIKQLSALSETEQKQLLGLLRKLSRSQQ